jgi:threonine/homoserine/homoserine lactone efflux protein
VRAAVAFGLGALIAVSESSMLIGATQPMAGILRREKVIEWMDRTTGRVFVLFATRLAFSKH